MRVHPVNPSDLSFGTAVVTPRWLFVLAAATPSVYGTPVIVDETLEPFDPQTIEAGDVVGIGIHTGNALRGYRVGQVARGRGAHFIYGGIHATLFPDECHERGEAHAVVRGDGDLIWASVLADCAAGTPLRKYEGGRVDGGSVQTVRGCPKHCSFCSVWRTDGQKPRQRGVEDVVSEVVELRRRGFRFIL